MPTTTVRLKFSGLGAVPPAAEPSVELASDCKQAVSVADEINDTAVLVLPPTRVGEHKKKTWTPSKTFTLTRDIGALEARVTPSIPFEAVSLSHKVENVRGVLRLVAHFAYASDDRNTTRAWADQFDIKESTTFQDALVVLAFIHQWGFSDTHIVFLATFLDSKLSIATSLAPSLLYDKDRVDDWLCTFLGVWEDPTTQPNTSEFVRAFASSRDVVQVYNLVWTEDMVAVWLGGGDTGLVACDLGDFLYRMASKPRSDVVLVDRTHCAAVQFKDSHVTCFDIHGCILFGAVVLVHHGSDGFIPADPRAKCVYNNAYEEHTFEENSARHGPRDSGPHGSLTRAPMEFVDVVGEATLATLRDGMPPTYHPGTMPTVNMKPLSGLLMSPKGEDSMTLCAARNFPSPKSGTKQVIATTEVASTWRNKFHTVYLVGVTEPMNDGSILRDADSASDTIFADKGKKWDTHATCQALISWTTDDDYTMRSMVLVPRHLLTEVGHPLLYPQDECELKHSVSGIYADKISVHFEFNDLKRPRLG